MAQEGGIPHRSDRAGTTTNGTINIVRLNPRCCVVSTSGVSLPSGGRGVTTNGASRRQNLACCLLL